MVCEEKKKKKKKKKHSYKRTHAGGAAYGVNRATGMMTARNGRAKTGRDVPRAVTPPHARTTHSSWGGYGAWDGA